MLVPVSRVLQRLFGSPPRPRVRRSPLAAGASRVRLGVEVLEARETPSHLASLASVPHHAYVAPVPHHGAPLPPVKVHTPPPVVPAPAPKPAPTPPPVAQPPAPTSPGVFVNLEGTLETGVTAIGGETTGILLQTSEGTFELDFGSNQGLFNSPAFNGKQVEVTGFLNIQHGVEIPVRYIVSVTSLNFLPTPPTPPPSTPIPIYLS